MKWKIEGRRKEEEKELGQGEKSGKSGKERQNKRKSVTVAVVSVTE